MSERRRRGKMGEEVGSEEGRRRRGTWRGADGVGDDPGVVGGCGGGRRRIDVDGRSLWHAQGREGKSITTTKKKG